MNNVNQKIIDAIIAKAEKVCPDSLALIGVYGSVATGDEYEKSDLDLLILIQDDEGWKHEEVYKKSGITVKRFVNVDEFVADYLGSESFV